MSLAVLERQPGEDPPVAVADLRSDRLLPRTGSPALRLALEHVSIFTLPPSHQEPSSEKYDMPCPKSTTSQLHREGVVIDLAAHARGRTTTEPTMRCVSSGYMSGGDSCSHRLPESIVRSAWESQLAHGARESRFFQFAWRGRTWLGFGHANGEIRGVYCPVHRAEREARSAGCEAQHYAPVAASA